MAEIRDREKEREREREREREKERERKPSWALPSPMYRTVMNRT